MDKTNRKVGITFGAFEYVHLGHIFLLQHAKQMCDELIVCISDDEYIETKKGHTPEFNWHERVVGLSSIKEIDSIGVQSLTFGKKEAVEFFKPDVIFVGSDWKPETFSGEGLGVPVIYLPRTQGISSTKLRGGK